MGRGLIKLDKWYLEWSTIVDAPVTYGMSKEETYNFYKEKYGNTGLRDFERDIEECDKRGTCYRDGYTLDNILSCNRAGPKETEYTKEEIIEHYCIKKDA
jgi:hypothetical protein